MGCAHTTANVRQPTSITMASKLPVRRQLNLNGLADDLEAKLERTLNLRNDKIYAKFAANFVGHQKPPIDHHAPAETIESKPPPAVIKPVRKTNPVVPSIAVETPPRLKPHPDTADSTAESSSDAEPAKPTADDHTHLPPQQLDRITRRNWRSILAERDEHIDRLIARLDELHAHNIRFAADNRQLLRQQQRPRTPCATCSEHSQRCERLGAELRHHSDHNATLTQDVHMLKTLVYRLNVQLERHQDELRRVGAADDAAQAEPQPPPPASAQQHWGAVNAHTLAPLLHAYTAMHTEQRDLVAQYERDAAHFTGRLKDVLAENELLHADLDRLRCSTDAWLGDRTRLQAQLDVCRHTADVQTQRADLAKQKLVEVLRCYEQKVQAQQLELERVQEAYARANGELQALRGMQQNPEVVVESLRECQRLFEELKAQHDTERAKLVADCAEGRRQCAAAEERWRAGADELDGVRRTLRERELDVSGLVRKNAALRQSLGRVRLTREAFRTRLKHQTAAPTASGVMPSQQQPSADANAADVELLVRQRTQRVQTEVHARYVDEIERLSRKLQQRDDTLRRVLQTKMRPGGSGMAAKQPAATTADKPVTII